MVHPASHSCVGQHFRCFLERSGRNKRIGRTMGQKEKDTQEQNDGAKLECGIQNGFWSNSILIPCADGKYRRVPGKRVADSELHGQYGVKELGGAEKEGRVFQPEGCGGSECQLEIEPALFPLADGIPNRVGLLRGAGNSINPWCGAVFAKAFMEIYEDRELFVTLEYMKGKENGLHEH